ncbi:cupin domain-containing protein [Hoeflea alexandrii]|uniref:cupin domain-containing protein n=1 Tax=Hoeflea alexandrii TaxID=288436 RepID=UPI0022AECBA8|nr:cupin domain-containing protein [Hoeflea alexandrii]MCZ4291587.1 cupin domain-containing protein [Hoeflea alexandrii]
MTTEDEIRAANGLDDLYPVLSRNRYTAGWNKKSRSLWPEPATALTPQHWSYSEARAALEQAGRWIGTDLAERRNLLMFNPVEGNEYDTVNTLVAAYQMIKPGEHARAHRHTPNALRLILEAGAGLFTVVDGVKLPMVEGDVLLTPGRAWHSHFNEGDDNAYWIDILDVPLVHRLEPMFFEELAGGTQAVIEAPQAHPYWFSRAETEAALALATPDKFGMRRHRLESQGAIPTMELSWLALEAGASTGELRSTESRIYAATRGHGQFTTAAGVHNWGPGDVFAAPGWAAHTILAQSDARIFEVSDAPVMRAFGFYFDADNRP